MGDHLFFSSTPSVEPIIESDDPKADQIDPSWLGMTATRFCEIQAQCVAKYNLPKYQKQFSKAARKCYPDMVKYVMMIEPILVEVEGCVFLDNCLCEDTEWDTVQLHRCSMIACMMKLWDRRYEVKKQCNDMVHATRQDQVWT